MMVRTQNRKTVTLRLTIRRENAKLDKLNFEPKYQMVYNICQGQNILPEG